MPKLKKIIIILSIFIFMTACKNNEHPSNDEIKRSLLKEMQQINGDVALAFMSLSNPNDTILINANEKFHAASTMKVPVMIELFKQATQHKIELQDSIILKNEFKSIVDKSIYSMDIKDDSDDVLYKNIGTKVALSDLMFEMITISSNLATNVLIELVDAKKVTQSMRELGAEKIEVLRGVEDQKAYDLGLNNTTTANDLLLIMEAIATDKAGSRDDCKKMIDILKNQKFNEVIPFYLPKNVEIAHKTGSITGVHHDAAIVYLPDGRSYVLVLMSKNLKDFDKGTNQLAKISKSVYDYMMKKAE